jgi:hypothetical protein
LPKAIIQQQAGATPPQKMDNAHSHPVIRWKTNQHSCCITGNTTGAKMPVRKTSIAINPNDNKRNTNERR